MKHKLGLAELLLFHRYQAKQISMLPNVPLNVKTVLWVFISKSNHIQTY